jgi:hypothetical protein
VFFRKHRLQSGRLEHRGEPLHLARLRSLERPDALRPILVLHAFRFEGLAFLVPGVVSPDLPTAFAHSAAYGDLGAAVLALLSLASLSSGAGVVIVWVFNLWGTFDLLHAFYEANAGGLMPASWAPLISSRLFWCRCSWSRML